VRHSFDRCDIACPGTDHQSHQLSDDIALWEHLVWGGWSLCAARVQANGAVDPNDPLNALIQDIKLAPKVNGLVQYAMDVTILMPTDLSKSNHVMLFDVPNRGNRLLPGGFNIGGSITSAGDGVLHSLGFIMVASGWQGDVLPGSGRLTMTVPVAHYPGDRNNHWPCAHRIWAHGCPGHNAEPRQRSIYGDDDGEL